VTLAAENNVAVGDGQAPSAASSQAGAGRPGDLWRAEPFVIWPRYARIPALCLAVSLLWLVSELLWPLPAMPHLANVAITHPGEMTKSSARNALDPASFEQSFASRKLFVPEVPVESHELSRKAIDEQLSHMKLTAIVDQGGELAAWVEVSGLAKSESGSGKPSPAGVASETRCVKKGDYLGDFKVTNITPSRVDLKIAGFDAHLSY
jgi:hypothetical protein